LAIVIRPWPARKGPACFAQAALQIRAPSIPHQLGRAAGTNHLLDEARALLKHAWRLTHATIRAATFRQSSTAEGRLETAEQRLRDLIASNPGILLCAMPAAMSGQVLDRTTASMKHGLLNEARILCAP